MFLVHNILSFFILSVSGILQMSAFVEHVKSKLPVHILYEKPNLSLEVLVITQVLQWQPIVYRHYIKQSRNISYIYAPFRGLSTLAKDLSAVNLVMQSSSNELSTPVSSSTKYIQTNANT